MHSDISPSRKELGALPHQFGILFIFRSYIAILHTITQFVGIFFETP